eukprot:gb/GEZN01021265.1/.p1 GENE.gb/GEZN01021265.1/~~gb/GEZN01021265.1/.p1  ORF type:complete len:184 (-),score=29.42 gb/GEZN01021265.1/:74-625(-)
MAFRTAFVFVQRSSPSFVSSLPTAQLLCVGSSAHAVSLRIQAPSFSSSSTAAAPKPSQPNDKKEAPAKPKKKETVPLTFLLPDGEEVKVAATVGDSLLQVAWDNDVELEGACEASLACSTCHVILPEDIYNKLPAIEDDEQDMLDMALGLTDTSRLGCQVLVAKDMAGAKIRLPEEVSNLQNK